MKKPNSFAKKFISIVISVLLICTLVLNSAAVTNTMPKTTLYYSEVPVEQKNVSTSSAELTMNASDGLVNSNGAAVANGLSAYNQTTIEGMFEQPISGFYKNAAGIDSGAFGSLSWNQFWGMSMAQLKDEYNKYSTSAHTTFSLLKSTESENPVKEVIDFTFDLALSAVSTNNPGFSDIITVVGNSTSATDLFIDPVQHSAFSTVLAATSGKSISEIDDTSIGDIAVDITNKVSPANNGVKYNDLVDILVGKLNDDEDIQVTRTTNITVLLEKLITSSVYQEKQDKYTYPTVFWIEGNIDTKAKFNIGFEWPDIDTLQNDLYISYDGVPLTSSQVSMSYNDDTSLTNVSLSDVFANSGIHTIYINNQGSPMFFYLNLNDPDTTTKSAIIEPPSTTQKTDGNINTTILSDGTTANMEITSQNSSQQPNIPKTGGKIATSIIFSIILSSAGATAYFKRKKFFDEEK